MKKFLRLAQGAPPPPPPGEEMPPPGMEGPGGPPPPPGMEGPGGPPPEGDMGGGPPPPPPPMGGEAPPPGAPPGAPAPPVKVNSSLDTPIDILADADATDLAMSGMTLDKIRDKIWEEYGGEVGENKAKPGCSGMRSDDYTDLPPEKQDEERKSTKDKKWKRLPEGKNITDIVGYDEMKQFVAAIVMKESKPAAPAGGAGGGMPPPMASNKIDKATRIASLFEILGQRAAADEIDSKIRLIVSIRSV